MSARQGFALPIIIIAILIPVIILAAWAPWVNYEFARDKALKSLNSSCRQLNRDEYSVPVMDPYWKQPSIPERLGLVPPFGQEVTLYVLCNNTSSENKYFVSFLGAVKLKESTPIPHRVSTEQLQNTIEKIDETANWKTYTNTKYKYSFKYPNYSEVVNGVEQLPDSPSDVKNDNTTNAILVQSTKLKEGNYFGLYVIPNANNIDTFKIELQKKSINSVSTISVNNLQALSYTDSGSQYIELFNNGYEYQIIITDQKNTNKILSTFQFLN